MFSRYNWMKLFINDLPRIQLPKIKWQNFLHSYNFRMGGYIFRTTNKFKDNQKISFGIKRDKKLDWEWVWVAFDIPNDISEYGCLAKQSNFIKITLNIEYDVTYSRYNLSEIR